MFNDRGMGFVVRRIMDVVEAQLPLPGRPSWEASIGSVVIGDQIVDVVDLLRLIRMVDPAFFDEPVAITDSSLA